MENKRKYKIVASDLDGTLLAEDQSVSSENLLAIAEMRRLGVEFVPTTGRTVDEFPADLIGSPDIRYMITSDGAAIWDKTLGEMVITNYYSKEKSKFVMDTVNSFNTFFLVHEGGKTYYDEKRYTTEVLDACRIDSYFRQIIRTKTHPMSDFENYIIASKKAEMFVAFFASDEDLQECRRILLESGVVKVAQSAKNHLEIYLSEAGKGNALKALAEKLGVDISEVIAVGDSMNDVTLLEAAGLSLAVSNALPEVKKTADKTICHHRDHSAKYILENFILQK